MKISIIGTGYVGLVQGACFADSGNDVVCMDIDEKKVTELRSAIIPIFEPGLEEMVKRNLQEGRLEFTTSLKAAVEKSDIIFLCLPTPQSEDGSADLSHVLEVSEQIAQLANGKKILVSKSTVPVGTSDKIKKITRTSNHVIEVASNPEFLKEGTAVQDSLKPDRVIVGSSNPAVVDTLKELYEPFVRTGNPIIVMDERSAEMTKYAANGFLAARISFMNELANLCERVGADIDLVRKGIGSDPRIGKQFLFAGVGYGGSCFPKDVKALIETAKHHQYELKILQAVDEVNVEQKRLIYRKLRTHFDGNLKNRTIAVWGLAFKPNTDDMREAPSVAIIEGLIKDGAAVHVHDPVAMKQAMKLLNNSVRYFDNNYEALKGADALIVVTEWNEFRQPDFGRMKSLMRGNAIFDGRNIYDPKVMREKGFEYFGVGRGVGVVG
jgi:UDPglucose 6-dehydrogenase